MNKRIKNIIRMSVFVSLFLVLTFISPVWAEEDCVSVTGKSTYTCENRKQYLCLGGTLYYERDCDLNEICGIVQPNLMSAGTICTKGCVPIAGILTYMCEDRKQYICSDLGEWIPYRNCATNQICKDIVNSENSAGSECADEVILPESIEIIYYGGNSVVPDSLSMSSDESLFVKVIVGPDNVTNKKAHWISNSDSPVVTVSEYNGDFGSGFVLKASKRSGEVTFFAIADGNEYINKSIKIKVSSEVRDVEQQNNNTSIKETSSTSESENTSLIEEEPVLQLERNTTSSIIPDYPNGFKFAGGKVADIFSALLPYIYVIAGLILLFMLIFGGIGLMTAAGDPKKMEASQKRITMALVGFLIVFVAYFVVQLVEVMLGIKIL